MMRKKEAGFTLMETMVALVVLLAVSAVVMSGMMQMIKTEGTISNRTEMHTSVRSATELLQQEIGQAGGVSPPLDSTGTAASVMTLNTREWSRKSPADGLVRGTPRTAAAGVFKLG